MNEAKENERHEHIVRKGMDQHKKMRDKMRLDTLICTRYTGCKKECDALASGLPVRDSGRQWFIVVAP